MRLILLINFLILTTIVFSQTPRGRVQIQDGTIVTDRGTLLRGAFISTDVSDKLPRKSYISDIKRLGLNCIHLYAECYDLQTPGERVELVDSLVNWTENDSLYLIITIGGCSHDGTFNLTFVKAFWTFYAQRYKDKTHVIFEIKNEPYAWSAPYDSSTIAMEKVVYQLIRSYAPKTHILLMSYAQAKYDTSIVADVKKLGDSIDWSNASIAIHGYGAPSKELTNLIKTVKASGYAVTVTEPESIEGVYVNLASTRVFEQEFVSYAHFITVQKLIDEPSVFKSKIESSEIRWQPDFGAWPENITAIKYNNPYESYKAGFYDEGYGFNLLSPSALGYINSNDYVAYYNFDFETGPDTFEAECSSAWTGGNIELHLDSLSGPLVGLCTNTPTGGWDVYMTFSCTVSHFNGVHKLYLVFKGDNRFDLFDLKSFVFKKSIETTMKSLASIDNQRIQIYPNPTRDFINVSIDESSTVEIFNIQGQLLINMQISIYNNIIQVSNLSSGSYIIKIISNTRDISQILIIK